MGRGEAGLLQFLVKDIDIVKTMNTGGVLNVLNLNVMCSKVYWSSLEICNWHDVLGTEIGYKNIVEANTCTCSTLYLFFSQNLVLVLMLCCCTFGSITNNCSRLKYTAFKLYIHVVVSRSTVSRMITYMYIVCVHVYLSNIAVTLRTLTFQQSIADAIEAKRLHHQLLPEPLYLESKIKVKQIHVCAVYVLNHFLYSHVSHTGTCTCMAIGCEVDRVTKLYLEKVINRSLIATKI